MYSLLYLALRLILSLKVRLKHAFKKYVLTYIILQGTESIGKRKLKGNSVSFTKKSDIDMINREWETVG